MMRHEPRLTRASTPDRQIRLYSSRELLGRLSAKWTMSVLQELASVPDRCLRFSELKSRLTGVSQRMLAATLKALERDGLLLRCFGRDRPQGSGYVLTPLGASMLLALEGFISLTMAQWSSIEASRRSYDYVRARAASRASVASTKHADDRADRRSK